MVEDIRHSDHDDIERYIRECTPFDNTYNKANKASTYKTFSRCINFGFAKKYTVDGEIRGVMLAVSFENAWGDVCSMDILTYASSENRMNGLYIRSLLKAYQSWTKRIGINPANVLVSNTWGGEAYDRLLAILGYNISTKTYTKE